MKNQTIYWDVDDVVLTSLEAIVTLINEKYNKPNNLPCKTVKDVKDWGMTSIYKNITHEELEVLFASEDFFNTVEIKPEFLTCLTKKILSQYNQVFVTKGCQSNLERKYDFLSSNLPQFNQFEYIGMLPGVSKGSIDMSDGILIDDNIKNLIECNAKIKILLTNNLETCYNNAFGNYADEDISDIYIVNTLDQVKEILEFNLKHDLITLK